MQKLTVFTIFFAIVAVLLTAQLLAYDRGRDGWTSVLPPQQVTSTTPVVAAPAPPVAAPVVTPSVITEPTPVVPAAGAVSSLVGTLSYRIESLTDDDIHGIGFTTMHLERVSAEGLLYQLLDVNDVVTVSKARFHLTDGKNVYGVLNEFLFSSEQRAQDFYAVLKTKAQAFAPDIKINETNDFGARSFFMNDAKRLGTAFLTFQSGQRVFGLSYPKASHEFFKKLIALLMR